MSATDRTTCITVIGAGAIGTSLLPLLATMRPDRLRLVDGDKVEANNLVRQPLYGPGDIGKFKVHVASERLKFIAPDLEVEVIPMFLDTGNFRDLVASSTCVVDCTDDLNARLLIDQACGVLAIPLVSGAVHRDQLQVMSLHYPVSGEEPPMSLRSFFPSRAAEEQESCFMQDVPVEVTAMAAAIMARHVRAIMNSDLTLSGKMDLLDVAYGSWLRIAAPSLGDPELIAAHDDPEHRA